MESQHEQDESLEYVIHHIHHLPWSQADRRKCNGGGLCFYGFCLGCIQVPELRMARSKIDATRNWSACVLEFWSPSVVAVAETLQPVIVSLNCSNCERHSCPPLAAAGHVSQMSWHYRGGFLATCLPHCTSRAHDLGWSFSDFGADRVQISQQ